MVAQASGLRWRLTLQCAVFPAQVVIALEKLRLRIERRPTLGETARLAMQRRDVLTNRSIEAFQERGRNLFERSDVIHAPLRRASNVGQLLPGRCLARQDV